MQFTLSSTHFPVSDPLKNHKKVSGSCNSPDCRNTRPESGQTVCKIYSANANVNAVIIEAYGEGHAIGMLR